MEYKSKKILKFGALLGYSGCLITFVMMWFASIEIIIASIIVASIGITLCLLALMLLIGFDY